MGLTYKVIPVEKKELSEIVCDRCDKRISVICPGHWNTYGEPHSVYFEPYTEQEYVVIKHTFGFFSDQKDGSEHESVLCESCYDELFKDVKVKITEYL